MNSKETRNTDVDRRERTVHERLNEIEHGLDRLQRDGDKGLSSDRRRALQAKIVELRDRLNATRDLYHGGWVGDESLQSSPFDDLHASYLLALNEFSYLDAARQGEANLPANAKNPDRPAQPQPNHGPQLPGNPA